MNEVTGNALEHFSAEMAEKVIHSVPDMIFIVDRDYTVRRILNYDPEKLPLPMEVIVGSTVNDLIDENYVDEVLRAIDRALVSDEIQEVAYTITYSDSIQYFEGYFKRIQENLVACFERNVTKRKEYESEISRMQRINRLVFDNTNSCFVYIDNNYIVQWKNVGRAFEVEIVSGYKTGTYCFQEVMGRTEPCEFCVADKSIRTGKIERMDFIVNEDFYVEVIASPVYDEDHNPLGVVLKYDDVTARRKAAEELRIAKEAAETSDKLKSMFISSMSHEIRTPLNAIVGFSDLLCMTEDPQEKVDFVAIIKHNNELLLQLINDILDLARIEADSLEFVYSDVVVNDLFRDLEVGLSNTRAVVSATNVKLSFISSRKDCIIHTEKKRIQQVLVNLINNAFKFTVKGEIRVGYELGEDIIRFYVQDTGKGIPADKRDKIFERFVKLNNFICGTGLGLSICQAIVHKLGGAIGVESTEGVGSTFWFTLPIVRPSPALENIEMIKRKTSSGYTKKPDML